jgi:hypothetical protein
LLYFRQWLVADVVHKELEFRGINLSHLGMYFEDLGAEKVSDSFPLLFETSTWKAEILSEDTITITSSFQVNSVKIRFSADDEETVEQLIKNYRKKTTRVGG